MNQGGRGIRLVPGLAVRAGQTIAGKYRVEELIGSGASGVVLSARNILLRQQVALKILASYTDGQEELLRRRVEKARLASRLKGEHVAHILDIGLTEDAMPYVATEWLSGTTLEAELVDRGQLPVEEAVRWVLQACAGLAEAHAAGLVHGDLKPQNIFLAEPKRSKKATHRTQPDADAVLAERDRRVLKILDFGTTSPLEAIGDQSASAFFGSPAFLAPEQIQDASHVDARADLWALGVLLYDCISGKLPFEADSVSGVIIAVVHDKPGLLSEAPYELAKLVARCLEKDPANRPNDVAELAAELAPFAGSEGPRLAKRVATMLHATPIVAHDAFGESSVTGSVPPVSMSLGKGDEAGTEQEPALPLLAAKRPARAPSAPPAPTQSTRPSMRVKAARRRWRARATAYTLVGAAAAIALASWATDHPSSLPAFMVGHTGRAAAALTAPEPVAAPPSAEVVAPSPPASLPVESLPTAAPAETPLSFAPTTPESMIPTPLATTPTPLATAERSIPAAALPAAPPVRAPSLAPLPPPFVLPAPTSTSTSTSRAVRNAAPTPYRLPPGLPRTRDGRTEKTEAPATPLFSERK